MDVPSKTPPENAWPPFENPSGHCIIRRHFAVFLIDLYNTIRIGRDHPDIPAVENRPGKGEITLAKTFRPFPVCRHFTRILIDFDDTVSIRRDHPDALAVENRPGKGEITLAKTCRPLTVTGHNCLCGKRLRRY